jgi:glycopeptide antibiotics resistance protein
MLRSLSPRTLRLLLVLYIGALLFGTLMPFRFTEHPGRDKKHSRHRVEWIPFSRTCPIQGIFSLGDIGLNIAMFIPFGALAALLSGTDGKATRRIARVGALGFCLSLLIETTQYFIPARFPSTTDLLMNTLGACLGALLAASLFKNKTSSVGQS